MYYPCSSRNVNHSALVPGRGGSVTGLNVSTSFMGLLAKEFLRKFCEKICGNLQKYGLSHQSRVWKFCGICGHFGEILRKTFCNDPCPNDPISELLKIGQSLHVLNFHVPFWVIVRGQAGSDLRSMLAGLVIWPAAFTNREGGASGRQVSRAIVDRTLTKRCLFA